jgi:hypothetical protein
MSIIERNNMSIAAKIVPAPQKTVNVYPTKDTYLSLANPMYPLFGKYNTLMIKNSETDAYKTIMAFDIPEIDPTDFSNLTKVNLTLYAMTPPSRDVHLILKYHYDNDWPENDITWMGQPVDYPNALAEVVFPAGETQCTIDLLNIFKRNGINYKHYAFTIIEDPAYGEQEEILYIGSREAIGTSRAPKLSYTYNWYPENFEVAEFDINFAVKKYNYNLLPIYFKVKNGCRHQDFNIQLAVRGNEGAIDDFKITMLPSPRVFDTRFKITFTVKQFANADFHVKHQVKGYHLGSDFAIRQLTVRGYGEGSDLNTDFYVRGRDDYAVKLKIETKNKDLFFPVNFAVRKTVDGNQAPTLPVTLNVKLHDNNTQELPITLIPRFYSTSNDGNLPIQFSVKSYNETHDNYIVNFIVRPNGELLYPVTFNVPGYEDEKDFTINFKVKGNTSIPIRMKTMIAGKKDTYHIRMKIKESWMSDVSVNMIVVEPKQKSYAFIM